MNNAPSAQLKAASLSARWRAVAPPWRTNRPKSRPRFGYRFRLKFSKPRLR